MVASVDPGRERGGVQLDAATKSDLSRVAREIAKVARSGPVLPGTLTHRRTRCGRVGCRCMADPPTLHGPYWSWTRKIERKTVTRYLNDEEARTYAVWFDNAKRLRSLLAELEALGLNALEARTKSEGPSRERTGSRVGSRRLSRG